MIKNQQQRNNATLTAASLPVFMAKLQYNESSLMQKRNKSDITSGKRDYHEKTAKTSARRQDDSDSDSDSDDEYERKRKSSHPKNSQRVSSAVFCFVQCN